MISSGSEHPIGDPHFNSFIGVLRTHKNLAGVQIATRTLGFSLILRLVRFGASTLKG